MFIIAKHAPVSRRKSSKRSQRTSAVYAWLKSRKACWAAQAGHDAFENRNLTRASFNQDQLRLTPRERRSGKRPVFPLPIREQSAQSEPRRHTPRAEVARWMGW